jgi:hypothetical protein
MPPWDLKLFWGANPMLILGQAMLAFHLKPKSPWPNLHDELGNQTLAHLCGRILPCHHSAPPWWSQHEAHLMQGAHMKVHVTHLHFEKVNIFVDILNMLPCYDKPFCLPPIHCKPFKSSYSPLWFYLCEGFFDFNIGRILNIFRVHLHHPSWWLNTSLMLHTPWYYYPVRQPHFTWGFDSMSKFPFDNPNHHASE